ncbi:hypothetical protein NQ318_013493 [Aromia moschata]|uniref:Uncharacterized protein n=1 Tax=Aromia moschata TaxID=1265417 RepID=A0AAV8YB45_9CUCU|nr:hypothetical protein NQ318_013493 [Aromia moschata]
MESISPDFSRKDPPFNVRLIAFFQFTMQWTYKEIFTMNVPSNFYIRLRETGYFHPKSNHGTLKTVTVNEEDEIFIRVSENPGLNTRRLIFGKRNDPYISLYSGSAVIASIFTSSPTICSVSTKYANRKTRLLLGGEFLIRGTIICGIPRIHML